MSSSQSEEKSLRESQDAAPEYPSGLKLSLILAALLLSMFLVRWPAWFTRCLCANSRRLGRP